MRKKILAVSLFFNGMFSGVYAQAYSWEKLPVAQLPSFKKDTINIKTFGAKNDGVTLNTKNINNAIAACSKKGGGVVVVPEGIWLTGPVEMQNNVNLYLKAGSMLLFTKDFDQYPLVEGFYEGRRAARNQSPVYGTNLTNIAITGKGVVDGNGDVWRMVGRDRLTASEWKKKVASGGMVSADEKLWYPSAKTKKAHEEKRSMLLEPGKSLKDFEDIKDYLRPNLLVFINCNRVLLEGVTFQNSPAWNLHPIMCSNITLKNVTVKNPEYAQNGDGIDLESCKNFLLEGCTFDVGDDAICIKSGKDEEGRKRGMPTENGVVRNCIVYKGHGGFVVGSEMSGGARNIFVENCLFMGTDKGLRFKTTRGRGGVVEHIYARNIFMKDIVQEAIFFDMYYFVKSPTDGERTVTPEVNAGTPVFRKVFMENIVCEGANKGIFIRGLPEMNVQDIHMKKMTLTSKIGAEIIEGTGIYMKNITLNSTVKTPVVLVENSHEVWVKSLLHPATDTLFELKGTPPAELKIQKN